MSVAQPGSALPPAISVARRPPRLRREAGPVVALAGVDLEVAPGEFFGLLGPTARARRR